MSSRDGFGDGEASGPRLGSSRGGHVPAVVKRTVHSRPARLLDALIEGDKAVDEWLHGEFGINLSQADYRNSLVYCCERRKQILRDAIRELLQLQEKTVEYESRVCDVISHLSDAVLVPDLDESDDCHY
jgi:hypothetical protein